jgi:hypothetical protein
MDAEAAHAKVGQARNHGQQHEDHQQREKNEVNREDLLQKFIWERKKK